MGSKRDLKSQAAMEFLVTYGWAVLVTFLVFVALIFFGVFSSDSSNIGVGLNSVWYYQAYVTDGTNPIANAKLTLNVSTGQHILVTDSKGYTKRIALKNPLKSQIEMINKHKLSFYCFVNVEHEDYFVQNDSHIVNDDEYLLDKIELEKKP